MFELIQVTAQYSNAVLVAILPQVSDFAANVGLPVPLPMTASQVERFGCSPKKDDLGGGLWFTNGLWVSYGHGHVTGMRTPRSYYNLQDPQAIPRFFGSVKLNQTEALQFARDHIRKLGYTLQETFTDQQPEVRPPFHIGTNTVPFYLFEWKDPVFSRTAVRVELDADQRAIQEMRLASPFLWRAPPRIGVQPKVLNAQAAVSATASNQFLAKMLPKISAFAGKLGLAVKLPVTKAQVQKVEFVVPEADVRVQLDNGCWFISKYGVVAEFNTPDSIYGKQPTDHPRPFQEYLGKWKMTEPQAIELVYEAIRRLGYTVEEFNAKIKPAVSKPDTVGKYTVPRYCFRWLTNDRQTGATAALVYAEVDADKKTLKHLQLLGERVGTDSTLPSGLLTPKENTPRPVKPPPNPFE